MAFPDNELSTSAVVGDFIGGRVQTVSIDEDFESGGIALNDTSESFFFQVWRTFILGSLDVYIEAPNTSPILLYEGAEAVTEVSATFDQNMRATLAFVENTEAKLQWFDTSVGAQVITNFGSTVLFPRVSLDDKRAKFIGSSDIIFTYIRDGNLYHRLQRDRFDIEYLLASDVLPEELSFLRRVGMSSVNRFQFEIFSPLTQAEIVALTLAQRADGSTIVTGPTPIATPTIVTPSSPTIWTEDNEEDPV